MRIDHATGVPMTLTTITTSIMSVAGMIPPITHAKRVVHDPAAVLRIVNIAVHRVVSIVSTTITMKHALAATVVHRVASVVIAVHRVVSIVIAVHRVVSVVIAVHSVVSIVSTVHRVVNIVASTVHRVVSMTTTTTRTPVHERGELFQNRMITCRRLSMSTSEE
jgi:hypothetical protein